MAWLVAVYQREGRDSDPSLILTAVGVTTVGYGTTYIDGTKGNEC